LGFLFFWRHKLLKTAPSMRAAPEATNC
jgi:hypothetical protein